MHQAPDLSLDSALPDPPKENPTETVADQLWHLALLHDDAHCYCKKGYTFLVSPAGPLLNTIAKLAMIVQGDTVDEIQQRNALQTAKRVLEGTEWKQFIK